MWQNVYGFLSLCSENKKYPYMLIALSICSVQDNIFGWIHGYLIVISRKNRQFTVIKLWHFMEWLRNLWENRMSQFLQNFCVVHAIRNALFGFFLPCSETVNSLLKFLLCHGSLICFPQSSYVINWCTQSSFTINRQAGFVKCFTGWMEVVYLCLWIESSSLCFSLSTERAKLSSFK